MGPDYSGAGVAVRDDIRETHRRMLEYLGAPGCWFTGAERLAIAAESRGAADCALCTRRKSSLSPEHPEGEHDRSSHLPEILIETAHRIRRDPQRLSHAWFQRTLAAGVEEGAYVELVGIVTFTAGLDYFCRALGVPPFPLGSAQPGEASRHRPANLSAGIAWVELLRPEDASGPEADLYDEGYVPNIARALSQVPDHVRMLQHESSTHYVSLRDLANPSVGRDLDRLQMELLAARVSALNECFY